MADKNNSTQVAASNKYNSKSELGRALQVFDELKKDAEESSSYSVEEEKNQLVLTMSSIGKLGRFGNQLFQYAFLRICAQKSGAKVECSPWIGQTLFGHRDSDITRRLPPTIERLDVGKSLFDVIPEFIPFLEKITDAKSHRVGSEALENGLNDADIWGLFLFHTRHFKPHQQYFRSLFQPVSDLESTLNDGLNILRSKGKTIVGIHIRRGDYIKEVRAGFTLVFPTKWYCEWLEGIWYTLEEPVLLLCSDELDNMVDDFEKFSPVTTKDLKIQLPERMKDLDLDFYIDFFMLSQCDVVCTSNSTFSFAACMLNKRANLFCRPHWNFSTKFEEFEPWDSQPLLWIGGKEPKFFKNIVEVIYITYFTQGIGAMLKSLFLLHQGVIKGWGLRVYLGYQTQGIAGAIKSFVSLITWHSAWRNL